MSVNHSWWRLAHHARDFGYNLQFLIASHGLRRGTNRLLRSVIRMVMRGGFSACSGHTARVSAARESSCPAKNERLHRLEYLLKRLGEGLVLQGELTANLAEGAAHAAGADEEVVQVIWLGVLHLPDVGAEPHRVDGRAAVPEGAILLTGLSKVLATQAARAEHGPDADLGVLHALKETARENFRH